MDRFIKIRSNTERDLSALINGSITSCDDGFPILPNCMKTTVSTDRDTREVMGRGPTLAAPCGSRDHISSVFPGKLSFAAKMTR